MLIDTLDKIDMGKHSDNPARTFFQSVHIGAMEFVIDFTPNGVQAQSFTGDLLELVSLIPIRDLRIMLPKVNKHGIADTAHLISLVIDSWTSYLHNHAHLCLAGINSSWLPIRPLTNVGMDVSKLLSLSVGNSAAPIRGPPVRHFVHGLTLLTRTVTAETLRYAAVMSNSTGSMLGTVREVLRSRTPLETESVSAATPVRHRLSNEPLSVRDGLASAASVLKRGFRHVTDAVSRVGTSSPLFTVRTVRVTVHRWFSISAAHTHHLLSLLWGFLCCFVCRRQRL